jgi:polyribonucleotide nucleotidyltransferase
MNEKHVFEYVHSGKKYTVEVGELAKQANGAVLVRYEDTAVLSAAVASKKATTGDFFPLMVLYQEKLYAAGKIPGGFFKREGRPTENETLTSRLIDRTLRPLFAEGFRNEVQVIDTVLSSNADYSSQMAAMLGSSLSLMVSDIPFEGPIAGVIVGRVNGQLIINPTVEEMSKSDIELVVAGTYEAINMVESASKEVSEADMLEAVMFGHDEIKRLVEFQLEVTKAVGKAKSEIALYEVDAKLDKEVRKIAEANLVKAVRIEDKLGRYNAIDEINDGVVATYETTFKGDDEFDLKILQVKEVLENIVKEEVRRLITEDKVRPDGRRVDEIRPLSSRVDVLERTHGSALFTRGQTQALGIVTLGALGEEQIIDGLGDDDGKRFMLHYNFPPFSVGETGRYGGAGRREIGHGALGERALLQVIPSEDEFPYTIRIVSEILESNGSTSQASICAGTMALMAAGVPIKAPVAGIAMGLITKGDQYTILTDIQGMEDHLGDMDFKVAGTKKGITALQMDIKIRGLSRQILEESLAAAHVGRMSILDHMLGTISTPRKELSKFAPKIKIIKINPDKIRDVIGAGGKVIQEIIKQCNDIKIDIEQDGRVFLMHSDYQWITKAAKIIEDLVREVEVGQIYTGKVLRVENYGAFVELWEGCDGLVHISQLAKERVEKTSDVVQVGDEIVVKVTGVDEKGRINLSRKEALPGNN